MFTHYTYNKIIASVSCILFLRLVLLHGIIFHGRCMHFKLGGLCFLSRRRILLLLPIRRCLFPKNWRSVFPKYFRGVFFHYEAFASYVPIFLLQAAGRLQRGSGGYGDTPRPSHPPFQPALLRGASSP